MSLTRESCALVYSAGFPKSESLCAIATVVFFGISSLHVWRLLRAVSVAAVTTAVMVSLLRISQGHLRIRRSISGFKMARQRLPGGAPVAGKSTPPGSMGSHRGDGGASAGSFPDSGRAG